MKSSWRCLCSATSEKTARVVLGRIEKALSSEPQGISLTAHRAGGFEIAFDLRHGTDGWNDLIIAVIEQGQQLGYGWTLHGDVRDQIDGVCTESRISGVEWIEFSCDSTSRT